MSKGFIVTGTDTDVGKTFVTAALSLWLQDRGVDIVPMKPVQTGAVFRDGIWNAPDLDFTLKTLGLTPAASERQLMQPFCYEPACSPHLAVGPDEQGPDVAAITASAEALGERHKAIVVEGAGGLMVPLNDRETMLDLFATLMMPVVLVGRVGLGTINHVLLSLNALRDRNIPVAGVVLNETTRQSEDDAFIRADNPNVISRFGSTVCLGTLPYTENPTPDALRTATRSLNGLETVFASLLGSHQP